VTLSSAEAEYVALAAEVQEIKYLRQLLKDLGHEQTQSTLIYEDNRACIMMASNEASSAGRCKHVHIKFRFTAEAIMAKEIRVRYIPTDFNYADLLTRMTSVILFHLERKNHMLLRSSAFMNELPLNESLCTAATTAES